jgi:hypothetical protein
MHRPVVGSQPYTKYFAALLRAVLRVVILAAAAVSTSRRTGRGV